MRRVVTIALVLLIAAHAATANRGFAAEFKDRDFSGRPQNSLEERLFADAADGRLDKFSPLAAALVAGGVNNVDELHRYEQKAESLAEELRSSEAMAGPPRQRAEIVFDFMHRRVLCGGYDLAANDLRVALDQGRFNCVTATVLFNYLAGRLGLECRGLETPSHAMSRVMLPEGAIDVETTCPRWFHLAGDTQGQAAAASKRTVPFSLTRKLGQSPREVSPIQLAAMIYYNRGVDLLAEKRFAEAVAANAKSLRLDPGNAIARGNLLATINNWSIHLGDTQHFAEAVALLRQGLAIDPKFAPFAQNYVHVHHQWVEHLCHEGHFEEASAVLSRAMAEMPDNTYLRRAESDVEERQAKAAAAAAQKGPLLQWPCVKSARQVD